MKPYHPSNLALQPYAHWKVIALAWAAKLLGVRFKIDGMPYGADTRLDEQSGARMHGQMMAAQDLDAFRRAEGPQGWMS